MEEVREAVQEVFEDYNRNRIHSSLGLPRPRNLPSCGASARPKSPDP